MNDFFDAVKDLKQEYETCVVLHKIFRDSFLRRDYKPELDKMRAERDAGAEKRKQESMTRLMKDMSVSKPRPGDKLSDRRILDEESDDEEEEDDEDGEILDRRDFESMEPRRRQQPGVYEDGAFRLSLQSSKLICGRNGRALASTKVI
jgi:hypothetical protein